MRDKKVRKIACMILVLTMAFPGMALAGPGAITPENSYDAETLATLQDNVIEYDELELLVHEYNETVKDVRVILAEKKTQVINSEEELRSQERLMKENAEAAKSSGNIEAMINYTGQSIAFKMIADGYREARKAFDKPSINSGVKQLESNMVSAAQSLMIGYNALQMQIDMMQTLKGLQTNKYELMQKQVSLGLATQTDVLMAHKEILSTESTILAMQNSQDDLRRTLCTLTGWSADAVPEIRSIPTVDLSRIDAINREGDIVKAIGNNYTLIEQRHASSGKSTTKINNRLNLISDAEQKLVIEMERLYQDILQKKMSYEAALTGLEHATLSKASSERMHQIGMIGKLEYLGMEISYLQKKATKESADVALFQALETYNWAVKGIAKVE